MSKYTKPTTGGLTMADTARVVEQVMASREMVTPPAQQAVINGSEVRMVPATSNIQPVPKRS